MLLITNGVFMKRTEKEFVSNIPPEHRLRWSPMLDFPECFDRNMTLIGPLSHTIHAEKERAIERGFPILDHFDSRGLLLKRSISSYGRLFEKYKNPVIIDKVKPYLMHIDTTIDPVTKKDVLLSSAWRFTMMKVTNDVDGKKKDSYVDMTIVISSDNLVITAVLTDKNDFSWHSKRIYSTLKDRDDVIRSMIVKDTLSQLKKGSMSLADFSKGLKDHNKSIRKNKESSCYEP